jgi:hypothetical protein
MGCTISPTLVQFVLIPFIMPWGWFVIPGIACERAEWKESSHLLDE